MKYHWIDPDFEVTPHPVKIKEVRRELTDILLLIYCRKNLDGTKHLALPGNYLRNRINRILVDTDLPLIARFLSANRDVVSVELSYNQFSGSELGPFMNVIIDEDLPIHYLGLMNCELDISGLETLAETVGSTNIETLRINDNDFGRNSTDVMHKLLLNCTRLSHLDVSNIGADWGLVAAIAGVLAYPDNNIQVLDVSRIVPNSLVSMEHTDCLAEMIELVITRCRTLKELHLRHNSLDGQDMERICEATSKSGSLLYLDLASNKIGDKGAEYLAEILEKRPTLTGLNLSSNNIGEIGGRALGHVIPHSILRMLDISRNRIKEGGLRMLLHCLKKPYRMRILSVWGNEFDNASAAIVYRMQLSGVLKEDRIDVRAVYEDGAYRVAEKTNPCHMHRHRYYLASTPPLRPMEPHVERPRKLKVDFTHVTKLPRPEPCPVRDIDMKEDGRMHFLARASVLRPSPSVSTWFSDTCGCRGDIDEKKQKE